MLPVEGEAVRSDRLVGVVRPEQRAVDPDRLARAIRGDSRDLTGERVRHVQVAVPVLGDGVGKGETRSEEHTSELQSLRHLVCRLLLEKKKIDDRKKLLIHEPDSALALDELTTAPLSLR